MPKVAMVLKKPPYGGIDAAEAVRHALGAASSEWEVDLILVHGGVLLAKKGQDDAGTGLTNLEDALKDCIDMGVSVYADAAWIAAHGIAAADLVDNINVVDATAIACLVKEARSTMIF